jgi:hypothetical protein
LNPKKVSAKNRWSKCKPLAVTKRPVVFRYFDVFWSGKEVKKEK